MKYISGEKVELLDVVKTTAGDVGKVVCSISDKQAAEGWSIDEWVYLETGVLAEFSTLGLVYFKDSEKALSLVGRLKHQT